MLLPSRTGYIYLTNKIDMGLSWCIRGKEFTCNMQYRRHKDAGLNPKLERSSEAGLPEYSSLNKYLLSHMLSTRKTWYAWETQLLS